MSEHAKKSVQWGGLTKTILAGAAIAVGVMICCPWVITSAIEAFNSLGTSISNLVTSAPSDAAVSAATKVAAGELTRDAAVQGLKEAAKPGFFGNIITKIAGAALAYTGFKYLTSDKGEQHEEHVAHRREAAEGFAVREDMRKMQALMVARMQNAGHAPAMGGGMGRS